MASTTSRALPAIYAPPATRRRAVEPPRRRATQLVFFLVVVLLWQVAGEAGLWQHYLFPTPLEVGERLVHGFSSGAYLKGAGITLLRLFEGYTISAVAGVALGLAIRFVPLLDRTLGTLVMALQALPSVCWLPLALLWFGLSQTAIVFVVVMGALLSITVATEQGIRNVPPIYVRAARTMGARGLNLHLRVMLPAALPSIITGMKLGWAFAWRSLMAAELLYVSGGLGQLLMMGREFNDIAEMVAVMVVIVVIGVLNDRLVFSRLERTVRERFGYDRA